MKKLSFFSLSLFLIILFFATVVSAQQNPLKELITDGIVAYERRNYSKAIVLLEKSLEIHPKFAPTYNYLGLAYKAKGADLADVTKFFEKAIELNPHYHQAYDNLGKIYYSKGQFDKAEKVELKALEINPNYASAQITLGWIFLLGKSSPSEAIHYFEKAMEHSDIPYVYFGLGMAYFMDQQKFKALEMITLLRMQEKEELATQLENMVRQGNYVPVTDEGMPLLGSRGGLATGPVPGPSLAEDNESSEGSSKKSDGSMKVRLRGKLPTPNEVSQSRQSPASGFISGSERIQQLRDRRANQSSDVDYSKYGY